MRRAPLRFVEMKSLSAVVAIDDAKFAIGHELLHRVQRNEAFTRC
jgi:hypothetical protein